MKFVLTILISVCAPGHYRHAVSDTFSWCERCPYDHYQDETNQQTCKPCPSGTKLQALGATSANQCIATGVITARKRSLGQGNIFASVCHSVHRGGAPGQVHTRYTPQNQVPPRTPPTPWDQVHSPRNRYTPPPLSSACWEIRTTSGRYAFYWNAFLFVSCV